MMVFKRKQIVVLSLILMIVVAGYLQYSYKQGSSSVNKDSGKLGEPVFVDNLIDNQSIDQENGITEAKKEDKNQKTVAASKQANDFFAQAKMDKDLSRSKNSDSLKTITDDVNAAKETKTKAYDRMMGVIENAEKEMRIETLIKEKGYDDSVALFGDDGSIDIVIKTPSLTSTQIAQIADIASRQANIDMVKIHVRSLY